MIHLGSTLRICTAEETWQRLQPVIKKIGITRVADVGGLDKLGVPVALGIRPLSKHLAVSQGKGLSRELARVSACMESLEGYHAENVAPAKIRGTYDALHSKCSLIDPTWFSPGYYNSPLLQDWVLDWIEGVDLITQLSTYIPRALVSFDSTQPHPEYAFFTVSSNGLGAGNSLEEAICHGLLEVIERDSLARWGRLPDTEREKTRLMLSSIDAEIPAQLCVQFQQAGMRLKIWDISSELKIPAFHCVILDPDARQGPAMFNGTGCHMDRGIALSRALLEAAQSKLTLITGSRDDLLDLHYADPDPLPLRENIENGLHYFRACPPDFGEATSFIERRDQLVAHLKNEGVPHIIVIDHTKPELNIPVVHVFIPGMLFDGHI